MTQDGLGSARLANARAVSAYTKTGFQAHRELDTPNGRVLPTVRDAAITKCCLRC
jgi:hypothetical protein